MPGFMLLPPPEGHCRICAVKHRPDQPHNADSLFYQMRFQMRYGRAGTWADACCHLPEWVQEVVMEITGKAGRWTEPPEGVQPIAEPIDG